MVFKIFFLLLVKNLKSDEATTVQYNFNLPLYRIIFIKSFWKVLNLLNPRWIRFSFAKFAVLENKTIVRLPLFNKTKSICWINRIVFIMEQIKKYIYIHCIYNIFLCSFCYVCNYICCCRVSVLFIIERDIFVGIWNCHHICKSKQILEIL
jgi:hypothetical protein